MHLDFGQLDDDLASVAWPDREPADPHRRRARQHRALPRPAVRRRQRARPHLVRGPDLAAGRGDRLAGHRVGRRAASRSRGRLAGRPADIAAKLANWGREARASPPPLRFHCCLTHVIYSCLHDSAPQTRLPHRRGAQGWDHGAALSAHTCPRRCSPPQHPRSPKYWLCGDAPPPHWTAARATRTRSRSEYGAAATSRPCSSSAGRAPGAGRGARHSLPLEPAGTPAGSPSTSRPVKLIALVRRPDRPRLLRLDAPVVRRAREGGRLRAGVRLSSRASGGEFAGWAPFWRYHDLGLYGRPAAATSTAASTARARARRPLQGHRGGARAGVVKLRLPRSSASNREPHGSTCTRHNSRSFAEPGLAEQRSWGERRSGPAP